MSLNFMRIHTFYAMLKPFSARMRRKRMNHFFEAMNISTDKKIIDLGGHQKIWNAADLPLQITILNLPGAVNTSEHAQHRFVFVEGDACDVRGFADNTFDVVFSNSVIEHVGSAHDRAKFAREVRRLGKSYWVQTPSKFFPIEAHNGMPFWWFYPSWVRKRFIDRWRRNLPAWTEMVEGTDIVSYSELRDLFPEAKIFVEKFYGIPKSYVAIHV
ncbi:methyltransferase domain-containing protein [Methylobacterium sp. B4]|uniref:methyltransferase domain-containing protein n=1 Tax=Methylobacterium sp. B4 TaxID=1938755 RepID=UPI000D7701B5|nr:methyltransferase domain-containing protein [Methylobacterium sp. B4]